jgi:hypothetical protein
MKSLKLALAVLTLATVAGLAYVAQQADGNGTNMVSAASSFVGTLNADQKKQAIFDYDSDERVSWEFIPLQDPQTRKYTRKGLPIEEMTAAQKKAALALVKAGTSASGYETATTIMSLEKILREQEANKGAMVRNPEWYFFTIFGTPSKTGKWGWRVEGHHLSINFTMQGSQVVASTPCFFGANPAMVKAGPDKGKRILPQAEDHARELFKSLDDEQKKVAHQAKPFAEPGENAPIKGAKVGYRPRTKTPIVGEPIGLAGAKMSKDQMETLRKLIKSYTERMPADIAEVEWQQAKEGGFDKVYFGFSGSTETGKGYTYRVQGPRFIIEFLNMQADSGGTPANHIHSCWRRIKGDFGL